MFSVIKRVSYLQTLVVNDQWQISIQISLKQYWLNELKIAKEVKKLHIFQKICKQCLYQLVKRQTMHGMQDRIFFKISTCPAH